MYKIGHQRLKIVTNTFDEFFSRPDFFSTLSQGCDDVPKWSQLKLLNFLGLATLSVTQRFIFVIFGGQNFRDGIPIMGIIIISFHNCLWKSSLFNFAKASSQFSSGALLNFGAAEVANSQRCQVSPWFQIFFEIVEFKRLERILCNAHKPNIDALIRDTHTLFFSILILNSQFVGRYWGHEYLVYGPQYEARDVNIIWFVLVIYFYLKLTDVIPSKWTCVFLFYIWSSDCFWLF